MKTIQTNNYPFSYIEDGEGSPVIFIHGSISDYRTWENQMEPFAKQFHVIAYSRRYHYPYTSEEAGLDYTVPQHSNDLVEFIKDHNLGPVNLIGSSYGGYVGLITAINNPDLVKTLVLGEPPVIPLLVSDVDNPLQALSLIVRDFPTGKSFLKFGIKSMNPAKKHLDKGNIEEGVRLFANGVLGAGGYEQLPEDVKSAIMENSTALKAEMLGPGFPDEFPKKEAINMQVPTLLVYAEKSPKFFHSISDRLLKILPNGQRVFIADASHDMHEQNPESFNKKVLEFLSKHN